MSLGWKSSLLFSCIFLFRGLVYFALLPPWQGYDEPQHVENVLLRTKCPDSGLPQASGETRAMITGVQREILASMEEYRFWEIQGIRKSNAVLSFDDIFPGARAYNQPPLWYIVWATATAHAGRITPIRTMLLGRFLHLAAATLLIFFGVLFLNAFWRDDPIAAFTGAGFLALWPMGGALAAGANTDYPAALFCVLIFLLLFRKPDRPPDALRLSALVLLLVAAVLTKRTALFMFPLVSVIFLWRFFCGLKPNTKRDYSTLAFAFIPPLLCGLLFVFVPEVVRVAKPAGWFFIGAEQAPSGASPEVLEAIRGFFAYLFQSSLGVQVWGHAHPGLVPAVLFAFCGATALFGLIVACFKEKRIVGTPSRIQTLALIVLFALIQQYVHYMQLGNAWPGAHFRYLLPIFPVLAALAGAAGAGYRKLRAPAGAIVGVVFGLLLIYDLWFMFGFTARVYNLLGG